MIIEVTEDEAIALFNLIHCGVPTSTEMWDRLNLLYSAMWDEHCPIIETITSDVFEMVNIPHGSSERRIVSKALA